MTELSIAPHLESLAAFPAVLRDQLAGQTDAAIRYQPVGEWSCIENVGHLIDIESTWMGRIRQMLSAENPNLQTIDPDAAVLRGRYQHKQLDFLFHTHAEMRAETVAFLRGLKPLHLARPGAHSSRGPITVADGIGILAKHDYLHYDQIAKTLAEYKP